MKSSSGTGKVTVDSTTGTASVSNVASADKLATARTISLSGDVTGSGSFNGTANLAITTALAGQAFTAGTYTKVTVNTKGIVTGVAQLSASDVPGGISAGKISGLGTAAWSSLPYLQGPSNVTLSVEASAGSSTWIEVPTEDMYIGGTEPTTEHTIWLEVSE